MPLVHAYMSDILNEVTLRMLSAFHDEKKIYISDGCHAQLDLELSQYFAHLNP